MPIPDKREFQLGDYWLSQRASSRAWYRTWFDNDTRQTRRVSLGTTDVQEARERLTEWFVKNHRPDKATTDKVTLAQTMTAYWEDYAQHLPSADTVQRACRY